MNEVIGTDVEEGRGEKETRAEEGKGERYIVQLSPTHTLLHVSDQLSYVARIVASLQ